MPLGVRHLLRPPLITRTREAASSRAWRAKLSYFYQSPDIFRTGVLHGLDNLSVSGTVEEHSCQFTIDTGCNISITRPDILPVQKHAFIKPVIQSFRVVTGEKVPILGKGDLCVRISAPHVDC